MFFAILLGLIVVMGIFSVLGGVLKKILEIATFIARLCVGGGLTVLIYQLLPFQIESGWGEILLLLVGAIIGASLIGYLASEYRLIGYSLNFFMCSFIVLFVALILELEYTFSFPLYAVTLFLFPRLMWISDRFATTREYVDTQYDGDTIIDLYIVRPIDYWEDSGNSWRAIPLQIVISSIFYVVGSITITMICPFESSWQQNLYLLVATALNVVFDMFAFRKLEEIIFD